MIRVLQVSSWIFRVSRFGWMVKKGGKLNCHGKLKSLVILEFARLNKLYLRFDLTGNDEKQMNDQKQNLKKEISKSSDKKAERRLPGSKTKSLFTKLTRLNRETWSPDGALEIDAHRFLRDNFLARKCLLWKRFQIFRLELIKWSFY